MSKLIGSDVSHHNPSEELGSGQFQIYKATEGKTFKDPLFMEMKDYLSDASLHGNLIGAYHFLSEKSGIAEQIEHFISTVEFMRGDVLLALDYEAEFARTDPDGKCLYNAIEYFKHLTGMQCLVYMNKSEAAKISFKRPSIPKDPMVSLWLADYKGDYKANWKPIMTQVCTEPFDIDVFHGSIGSWRTICKSWR